MPTPRANGQSADGKTMRPSALATLPDNIPDALKNLPQWLVWKYVEEVDPETGETDYDKPPFNARTGGPGSSTNSRTWAPIKVALAAYRKGGWDGLGFVLSRKSGDDAPGVVGVDLDKCRDPQTGILETWAQEVVDRLRSYTEVSPSGRGLRIFVLAKLPPQGRKRGHFECYETGRYVTVTGQRVEGTPATIEERQAELSAVHASFFRPEPQQEHDGRQTPQAPLDLDDAELLRRASAAKNGDRFTRLWAGDRSGYNSPSEADLALCNYLAFWCGPDEGRIADLFAQSGLFRSKWQREDYRRRTIDMALRNRTEFYSGKRTPKVKYGHAVSTNGDGSTNGSGEPKGEDVTPPTPPQWPDPVPLGELPEAAAFPITTLPKKLIPFVDEVAGSLNAPTDFAAVPLLAIAGGAIGNSRRLAIHDSHTQGAVLFACIIGSPGSGKSPALGKVAAPLEIAERRFYREFEQAVKEWAKSQKAKDGDGEEEGEGEEDERPKLRRQLLDDATTEVMGHRLADNCRGMMMVRDELAAVVTGLNQYKNGKGSDRQVYLKLWSQETIRIDRVKHPNGLPIVVSHPFCGIVGTIQPDVVPRLRGESFRGVPPPNDGFLDRWLLCFPTEPKAVGESWRCVNQTTAEAWQAAVDTLLALEMIPDKEGDLRPYLLRLDVEARLVWEQFTREHAKELNAEDFPNFLKGPWSKLRGYCGRLALIVHLLRFVTGETQNGPVDSESMDRAVRLVRYFKSHAHKAYAAAGADVCVADARRVLDCLSRNHGHEDFAGPFTRTAIYRRLRGHFRNKPDALDAPLRLLVDHHYLRVQGPTRAGQPGHNPTLYEISPRWDRRPPAAPNEDDEADEQGAKTWKVRARGDT